MLASSASSAELDRQNLLYNGRIQALGYEDQAALDRAAAGNDISSGIGSAVGVLLSGAATYTSEFPGKTDDSTGNGSLKKLVSGSQPGLSSNLG